MTQTAVGSVTGSSVELMGVSKQYGSGVVALDDVTMSIKPGEFVTFLGPSGSGKSTTLNIIAGFAAATKGSVSINGDVIDDRPSHKRNLGVVFQNYALFPLMTVEQNVAYGLRRRGVSKEEQARRVREALAMVRLEAFGTRRPAALSGGQQQRVALARALVYRPPVLLLDEPLGALDKRLREQMQEEIGRLHGELGTTFIFVTHDQEEALALSDRIALFESGRLVQIAEPKALYEHPATLFAAQFLGDSNLFKGVSAGPTQVRFGAQQLSVAENSVDDGAQCYVMVRPERLRLRPAAEARPDQDGSRNSVSARVTEVVYLGSSRRLTLRYADGTTGCVKEPVGHESAVGADTEVLVEWSTEHGTVLPVGSETGSDFIGLTS